MVNLRLPHILDIENRELCEHASHRFTFASLSLAIHRKARDGVNRFTGTADASWARRWRSPIAIAH